MPPRRRRRRNAPRGLLPLSHVAEYLRRGRNQGRTPSFLPSRDALRRLKVAAEELLGTTLRWAAQEALEEGQGTVTSDHIRQAIRRRVSPLYPSTPDVAAAASGGGSAGSPN